MIIKWFKSRTHSPKPWEEETATCFSFLNALVNPSTQSLCDNRRNRGLRSYLPRDERGCAYELEYIRGTVCRQMEEKGGLFAGAHPEKYTTLWLPCDSPGDPRRDLPIQEQNSRFLFIINIWMKRDGKKRSYQWGGNLGSRSHDTTSWHWLSAARCGELWQEERGKHVRRANMHEL